MGATVIGVAVVFSFNSFISIVLANKSCSYNLAGIYVLYFPLVVAKTPDISLLLRYLGRILATICCRHRKDGSLTYPTEARIIRDRNLRFELVN